MGLRSFLIAIVSVFIFYSYGYTQIKVGPRLGANFTTTTRDVDSDKPLKPGLNGGAASMFKLSYNFFVQPGLIYSQKGYKKVETPGVSTTFTYHYIDVRAPFYYRLGVFNADKYSLQVGGGAYFGALVSDGTADLDKSFDIGPTVSLEFLVNGVGPGNSTIVFQPAFDYGLINLEDPNATDSETNVAYTLSVMYLFNLDAF